LIANRLGFQTRVVYGARIGAEGVIRGGDVTAWVEIHTYNGWVAIPNGRYIPSRDQHPEETPPEPNSENPVVPVPPPQPAQPPGSIDPNNESQNSATGGNPTLTQVQTVVFYVAGGLGGVLLLLGTLLGLKLLRRKRRFKRRDLVARIHGGWQELLDRARDKGEKIPLGVTHRNQAEAVGETEMLSLAAATDYVMFNSQPPSESSVAAYLDEVNRALGTMIKDESKWRKFWVRINPRSLVPLANAAQNAQPIPQSQHR
jgi:hypothetical protein